jgi:hypothetical protein
VSMEEQAQMIQGKAWQGSCTEGMLSPERAACRRGGFQCRVECWPHQPHTIEGTIYTYLFASDDNRPMKVECPPAASTQRKGARVGASRLRNPLGNCLPPGTVAKLLRLCLPLRFPRNRLSLLSTRPRS